ncbi:MAG TPA: hypothetical protein VMS22_14160 [Candidatus Eisenbacteria bacterium]|nr:hypothetical protein [Candidatus Eisenbacteria bacterium]
MIRLPDDHPLHRIGRAALRLAGVAAIACLLGLLVDRTQFFRSYLVAYVYWTGAALGSLALLTINHVTGGAWGVAIRRFLEATVRLLPVLVLLFLPIALGLPHLYEWARPEDVAHDALLQHKEPYLNVPFFLARTAFYFAAWFLLARALLRWSEAQDASTDALPTERLELISRGGLLLMGLTMTFAAIDWMMSLEPHWSSTIYGVIFMAGSALTALALAIVLSAIARDGTRIADAISPDQFHDLGKLLLAFMMLWAYFNFSQFLITWSGNLPEEIPWYLARTRGGWRFVTIGLVIFHFALPFMILLLRSVKRRPMQLAVIAAAMLVARYFDVFWMIAPAFQSTGLTLHWLDVAAFAAVGGLFIGLAIRQLAGHSLVPIHDPSLPLEGEAA